MPGPHDLFARYTFAHPERAAAELRAVLPPHVVSAVDWSSLRREPSSVVDPELRETESDLLFSARLHGSHSVLLYVLLEHQSSVNRWMALRMLRYVVRQVEHWRQQHPESTVLPVIIPLVMYHGEDGAWSAARRVEDLFDLPGEDEQRERWRALVPRFEYLLDDLTAERHEALMARPGPPLARLAWLLLRYVRSEELAHRLKDWTVLFTEVHAAPEGFEHLLVITRYITWVGGMAAHRAAKQVLHSVLDAQAAETLMRSYGERLVERAERWGMRRGRLRGRAEAVLQILVARGIHVGDEAQQRILTCTDLATLDRWLKQAMNATTLSDVLDDLTS